MDDLEGWSDLDDDPKFFFRWFRVEPPSSYETPSVLKENETGEIHRFNDDEARVQLETGEILKFVDRDDGMYLESEQDGDRWFFYYPFTVDDMASVKKYNPVTSVSDVMPFLKEKQRADLGDWTFWMVDTDMFWSRFQFMLEAIVCNDQIGMLYTWKSMYHADKFICVTKDWHGTSGVFAFICVIDQDTSNDSWIEATEDHIEEPLFPEPVWFIPLLCSTAVYHNEGSKYYMGIFLQCLILEEAKREGIKYVYLDDATDDVEGKTSYYLALGWTRFTTTSSYRIWKIGENQATKCGIADRAVGAYLEEQTRVRGTKRGGREEKADDEKRIRSDLQMLRGDVALTAMAAYSRRFFGSS